MNRKKGIVFFWHVRLKWYLRKRQNLAHTQDTQITAEQKKTMRNWENVCLKSK